ncbi:MAG TPA: carbohydrate porin [Sideroxyarcus sp.]|nr:carbohydrate porin [Sideroxyarcus sp.]
MQSRYIKVTLRQAHLFLLLAALSMCGSVLAEDGAYWEEMTLSGDWQGKRSGWSERGVNLEFTHRSDVLSNVSGGLQRGNVWLSYTDARALFDLDKLYGRSGLTAFFHYHGEAGGKPNERLVGSFMGVDNIEVGSNTAQFYHAWLQQNMFDDGLSVLVGLYPVDSEFYVTDTSGVFLHPSMGMAAEVAQAGVNGPPVYPLGSFGTRIKYSSPNRTAYWQLALLDGVPGDPNNSHGTHIRLGNGDGSFFITEIGYMPLEAGHTFEPVSPEGAAKLEPEIKLHEKLEGFDKTAFGMWRYSARFDDLTDFDAQGNPVRRASFGWYVLAERTLHAEDDPAQGLAGFVRLGATNGDIQQSDGSFSMGLRYMGLLDGRDEDVVGIAVTGSHAGRKYRALNQSAEFETMAELTYRAQIRKWLGVQPLLQKIFHPNMDRSIPDATLLGVRVEVFL